MKLYMKAIIQNQEAFLPQDLQMKFYFTKFGYKYQRQYNDFEI